jgi:hypothetical protein
LEEDYEKIEDLITASEVIINIGNFTRNPLYQPKFSQFIFKLPPDYNEGYPVIVRRTVLSFIDQQKKNSFVLKTINSLSRLFKKLVENELGKTFTEDLSIDSANAHYYLNFEFSTPSIISNKMKMFMCNNCIHLLIKLGIISDINCTPIEFNKEKTKNFNTSFTDSDLTLCLTKEFLCIP